MVRLLPTEPETAVAGLESVLANAIADGAPEPLWVAVADGGGRWLHEVACLPERERAWAVVAATSDGELEEALRLGLGGAIRLPPSTPSAREALLAAAARPAPPGAFDSGALELAVRRGSRPVIVGCCDAGFWRRQLGDRGLRSLLAGLCGRLPGLAAVLPWPAVVVESVDRGRLESEWREVAETAVGVAPPLEVRALPPSGPADLLSAAVRAGSESRPLFTTADARASMPVHELPGGGRVGAWSWSEAGEAPGDGWLARPVAGEPSQWRLAGGVAGGPVVEVLTAEAAEAVTEASALRMPGWASLALAAGTPAALLVANLAATAARRGLPLWVPNVDAAALRFLLHLPGTLWVDGPAVPR